MHFRGVFFVCFVLAAKVGKLLFNCVGVQRREEWGRSRHSSRLFLCEFWEPRRGEIRIVVEKLFVTFFVIVWCVLFWIERM